MRYALYQFSCALLLTLLYTAAHAQEYSYSHYDVKDGLAGSVVYCGVKDKDGFLWFGTETGLSRFDGTHFRNFTTEDGLPDNEILKLFVDSKNRIWITTLNQALCYYYKGKFYTYQNDSLLQKLPVPVQAYHIVEDAQGNFMFIDTKAIYLFCAGKLTKVALNTNVDIESILTAGLTSQGKFKVLAHRSGQGVTAVLSAGDTVAQWNMLPDRLNMSGNLISAEMEIFRYPNSLHFGSPGTVKQSRATPPGFKDVSIFNDTICSINTDNGSFFYHTKQNKLIRHVLKGKMVNAVLRDQEDNYWFMTAGAGIFRIGSFDFRNIIFTQNNIDNYAVFSIKKIDSLIFMGSEKSLLYTMPANAPSSNIRKHQFINDTHNRIITITSLPGKKIILGTDVGLFNINQAGDTTVNFIQFAVKSLMPYKDQLLISTHAGAELSEANPPLVKIKKYIFKGRTTCSYELQDTFYIGTMTGFYQVDQSGKTTFLGNRYNDLRYRIADIKATQDGILWIGTSGRGLIGYKNGEIKYHIRKKDGLTSDICRTLFADEQYIWVGTDKGLNRVSIVNNQAHITKFTKNDGLISDIINAIEIDRELVYVGTPSGLTYFNADKIQLQSLCQLGITSLQAADQSLPPDTTGFILPPANNAIRFDFIGISYRSAGDITYRYRLVGLSDNWQTTRETFLSYPSLPSGNYELQLMATNKFGVESEMIRIAFIVEKFVWEKTWFRILTLLILGSLVWIFVNARIRKIRRLNDEKILINNRITELEQMALKAQMNPHFIFNSLNSVQQYVIDKDLRGANKFITEFSRLIRLTLDISTRAKISIYEEISYLSTYLELEKTKFEDKFTYSVIVEGDMDPSEWFIPPMILQPYVENSIRHGVRYRHDKLGHIKLSFSVEDQYLTCKVEDNGVGRKRAGEYKSEMPIEYQSKGMTLTAKRIEMLNKNHQEPVLIDIEDLEKDHIATGTRVVVRFPVQDAGHES